MAERSFTTDRWLHGLAFLGVFVGVMLVHLVPLKITPGRFPGPDLLICLTFAWVLRRPAYVPVSLVALLFLLADVLFMRPLGLGAALAVLAVEFLRGRAVSNREQALATEWLMVAIVLLAMTAMQRLVLGVFFVEQISFGLAAFQYTVTVLAYPLVVFVSHYAFKISKITPNETDAQGRPR